MRLSVSTSFRTHFMCFRKSSLRTADVSPRSSPLRDVSQGGTSTTQRQKFHTDDVNQCLHNNPVVMGFQMQICSILHFSLSILVKWSSANELHLNSNASSREDYIPQILAVFVRDSSRLHLTFMAFCLLSVIRKQWLKQWNYSVDQLALLTGFRTDFASSVWNFCWWVADVPPG